MAQMKLNEYKPKYGQDPAVFNEMYMNYIQQISNDDASEPPTPTTVSDMSRPFSQQSSSAGS